jgi:hypothetical protein
MDPIYAEVGAEVVIGFHRQSQYAFRHRGAKTTITYVKRESLGPRASCPSVTWCKVSLDSGFYWWSVNDMILASDIDLLTPEQRSRIK